MSKRIGVAALVALGLCAAAIADPQAATKPAANAADLDKLVELLRKDVRAGKADIVAKTMNFNAEQAAAFWPVYKLYEAERAALGDERLGIIQDFGEHFDSLNDAKAKGLILRSQALEEKAVALQKRYVDEFLKVLPAKTAGRFLQVDRRINMLIDLEVSSAIPLVN